jgi:hypothetical protein
VCFEPLSYTGLERLKRIEPLSVRWQRTALPLSYSRRLVDLAQYRTRYLLLAKQALSHLSYRPLKISKQINDRCGRLDGS